MQTVPIYATIDGLTIFRDDRDETRFHYLPRTLRIKSDRSGRPMFTPERPRFIRLERGSSTIWPVSGSGACSVHS